MRWVSQYSNANAIKTDSLRREVPRMQKQCVGGMIYSNSSQIGIFSISEKHGSILDKIF